MFSKTRNEKPWSGDQLYQMVWLDYVFSEFISIFNNKNELKNGKKRINSTRVPRGCDVALKATWQRHAGPRSAYAAYTYSYYLYIYIMGIQPSVYRKGFQTL